MQPNSDVMFIVTYDSGHEEWFWIDAQVIRGGDQMVGAMVKLRQQRGMLPEGNIQSIQRRR
jgi:hypothetical protein